MTYPITLNLQGKKATVVGAGKVALRKVTFLLKHGALVTIIGETIHPDIQKSAAKIIQKKYESGDLSSSFLVIAATNDFEVNKCVAKDCQKENILFSCVDQEIESDFFSCASLNRGALQIAISTTGHFPGIARSYKKYLDKRISQDWETFLLILKKKRDILKSFKDPTLKKTLLKEISSEGIVKLLEKEGLESAIEKIESILSPHV